MNWRASLWSKILNLPSFEACFNAIFFLCAFCKVGREGRGVRFLELPTNWHFSRLWCVWVPLAMQYKYEVILIIISKVIHVQSLCIIWWGNFISFSIYSCMMLKEKGEIKIFRFSHTPNATVLWGSIIRYIPTYFFNKRRIISSWRLFTFWLRVYIQS
jgi:hypothetical protein